MTGPQAPPEIDLRDWLLAIVLAGPLLLAVSANQFGFDFRADFRNYHLAVHYTLYLAGLALAIVYFLQDRRQRGSSDLAGWLSALIVLMLMADVAAPFQLVAAFTLLKALFYLLILLQLAPLVLPKRRVLRYSTDPYPFTLLLTLTTILLFQDGISTLVSLGQGNASSMQAVASLPPLALGTLAATVLLTIGQAWGWLWLSRHRVLLQVVAGAGACLLAANALLRGNGFAALLAVMPGLAVPASMGLELPISTRYLCLFLYLFAMALPDAQLKPAAPRTRLADGATKVVPVLFAISFLLLYFQINSVEIARSMRALSDQRATLVWGAAILLALLAVAEALGFRRARPAAPEGQPKPTASH